MTIYQTKLKVAHEVYLKVVKVQAFIATIYSINADPFCLKNFSFLIVSGDIDLRCVPNVYYNICKQPEVLCKIWPE